MKIFFLRGFLGLLAGMIIWTPLAWGAVIPGLDSVMAQEVQVCLDQAADRQQISSALLGAVVQVESSSWPYALGDIEKGKGRSIYAESYGEAEKLVSQWWKEGKSFSVGLGQIHTSNIKRYQLDPTWLLDPCVNVAWAAFILRKNIEQYGFNWTAVERYNGKNPQYPWKVWRAMKQQQR